MATVNNHAHFQQQYDIIFSHVLANLITLALLCIFYFNLQLFASYAMELVYAILISEALWAPRSWLLHYMKRPARPMRGWFVLLPVLGALSAALLSVGFTLSSFALALAAMVVTSFERHLFSDESLAAFLVILVFVVMSTFTIALLLRFALDDARNALNDVEVWAKAHPELRGSLREALASGKLALNSLSDKAVEMADKTAWAPLVNYAVAVLSDVAQGEGAFVWPDFDKAWKELKTVAERVVSDGGASSVSVGAILVQTATGAGVAALRATSLVLGLLDSLLRLVVASSLLFFLLSSSEPLSRIVLKRVKLAVPARSKTLRSVEESFRSTIEAVFFLPLALSCVNAALTLAIFFSFNVLLDAPLRSPVLAAALAFVFTPMVSPALAILPWVLGSMLTSDKQSVAVLLLGTCYVAFSVAYDQMLGWFTRHRKGAQRDQRHFTYLTHLAFFLGVSAFGIDGVIVGPLVVCVLDTAVHALIRGTDSELNSARSMSE
jgi:predicted PurR-regulated permease PerM